MLLTEMVVPKIVSVMIVQIKCGLSGPEASRMKPQTLKIPTTLTLQETCAGSMNDICKTTNCIAPPVIGSIGRNATQVDRLDWVPPKPWSDQNLDNGVERIKDFFLSIVQCTAGLFAAISMMIYMTKCANCLSTIIGSGRRMIMMMQPSKVLTCVTLVTCFAGHADASRVYYERGLCLQAAAAGSSLPCAAGEITGSVLNYTGPLNCTFGAMFNYSVVLKIDVGQEGTRCDVGAYFGLDGGNANIATGNSSCLVQVLDENDVTPPNSTSPVFDDDRDICYDVREKTIINSFAVTDLTAKCSNPSSDGNVLISVCFVWNTCNGANDLNCTDPSVGEAKCATPSDQALHTTCLKPSPNSVSPASYPFMD
jgi:hypothetical protein